MKLAPFVLALTIARLVPTHAEPSVERPTVLGTSVLAPPDLRIESEVIQRDPGIIQAWGLEQTHAFRAWRLGQARKLVTVAVIDTGIDIRHPDLRENIWTNPGESGTDTNGRNKGQNGVDDDGNGFVDDVYGWNFVGKSNNVLDQHGHGTHVAGIIGAIRGNGIGISGVAFRVRLMALKYYDTNSSVDTVKTTVEAIRYAVRMKADVINFSGGGLTRSDEEEAAIREAMNKGILFVAAAGNEANNSDQTPYFPADYELSNIVSVAAIDRRQALIPASNFGLKSVDLAAPGKGIFSTLPNGQYGFMTGTSQATAFVSGVAALVLSNYPDLRDPEELIKYLVFTGDHIPALAGKVKYRAQLNSYRALAMKGEELSVDDDVVRNAAQLDWQTMQEEIRKAKHRHRVTKP